jgi:peptidoglycan/LPS O-acetylase OafA/YrhL
MRIQNSSNTAGYSSIEPLRNISERYYPALDGLRGVAALMIVWHHFLQLSPMHGLLLSILSRVFGFTWAGVDLFFALSGFLITGILADTKLKNHYFRTFYGRRVLRIFPLYYGYLILIFFILPFIGIGTDVLPSSRIYYWTYTSNFYFAFHGWLTEPYLTHLWTLAIEEQFYLIWPLVIFLSSSFERLRRRMLWALLLIVILRFILYRTGIELNVLYLNTFTHCDGLILGGYLALSVRSTASGAMKGLRPSSITVVIFCILAFILANFGGLIPNLDSLPIILFGREVILLSIFAVLFVWLIHAATHHTNGHIFRFFSHSVLRWFGKYSYALYVLHFPIAVLLLRSDISLASPNPMIAQIELFAVYFGGSVTAAFLSWHLYEKHFLKLKKYLQAG